MAKKEDIGQKEAQKTVDKEEDAGVRGTVPDPTPNENYTVKGVVAHKPTPETDPKAAADAHAGLVRGTDESNLKAGKK